MILHEMAHLIAPENAHHSIEFWVIAWKLFRKYGAVDTQEDLMYVYLHEVRYMKTARKGFEKVFWDKSTVR
jgi:predicted metal-dependent hydrolase